jgi:amino acid permease
MSSILDSTLLEVSEVGDDYASATVSEPCPGHPKIGFFGTTMTLVNVLVGAGILGVPSTFDATGIISSCIVMTIVVVISHFATVITLVLQEATHSNAMDEIAGKIMGRKGMFALSVMILIFNFAAMLAYLIIGTDFIISWFRLADIDLSGLWPRAGVVLIYGLCIPIALCIPKSLKILSQVSTLTFVCILAYVVIMVFEVALHEKNNDVSSDLKIATMNLEVFASLSVYSLAFAMPTCVCPVIVDSDPDVRVRKREVACSLGISLVITIIPSVCAYRIYGSACQGNIINSSPITIGSSSPSGLCSS